MLNPKFIRDNIDQVKQNTEERGFDSGIVDKWLEIDNQRLEILQKLELVNKSKNELAQMGKQGMNVDDIREKGKNIKEQAKELEEELRLVDQDWTSLINQIPNIHFAEVPIGKSDKENVVIKKVGTPTKFDFEPKDHVELAKDLDIIDFEAGAKVSGSQFYYLKNDAVMLEFALIQFGLNFFRQKGYELVITPDLAKSKFYLGTGYVPRGDEAQIYEIEGEDLGLIATAEITMAGYFADQTLTEAELPKKYAAISHCFRKEAGAYGKYSKGLFRVHQFTKLEMFVYCTPEQSQEIHQELLAIEEEIAQALGIPYQVIEMCSGDLGGMAARKYDIEAWLPGRNDYGEITSTSNCTDFQARNMNIKFEKTDGTKEFVHMLNGTAIVLSRFPIAIIENFQQKDGSIKVPDALVPYMGKEYIRKN
jgi:seryl-tRNA synthetase